MSYPVDVIKYPISTAYGVPGSHWSTGYHTGVDQACPVGTPVYATCDGTVTSANWGLAYGTQIVVDQKAFYVSLKRIPGYWGMYAHLSKKVVSAGQFVTKGQLIGYTGNTGNSTGPHIHYEVRTALRWSDGKAVDPAAYLKR